MAYVRFAVTRRGSASPSRGELLAELTALPLVTHANGIGCVHHPGRRENRRRWTPA